MKHLSNLFALLALWLTSISLHAADLLVLMHDSGKMERNDGERKHRGANSDGGSDYRLTAVHDQAVKDIIL